MDATENSACPQCAQKGKTSRIITVFFKSEEALYTCEDKMCTFFLTDSVGNIVKYNKETCSTSYMLDAPLKKENSENDLNDFLNSLTNEYNEETNHDTYCTIPKMDGVQEKSKCVRSDNSSCQHVEKIVERSISSSYDSFNSDYNCINFDDFL